MNCRCTNEFMRNRTSLPITNDIEYPDPIDTVGQMWLDVSYSTNNNFIKSVLWGAKWTNLPNNELLLDPHFAPLYHRVTINFEGPDNRVALRKSSKVFSSYPPNKPRGRK